MLKLLTKGLSLILFCVLLANCSSGPPYANDKGQIVDADGMLVVANIGLLTPSDNDAAICGALKDPATLPWVSYSTQSGFNTCVARCLTDTTSQICAQIPSGQNILATRHQVFQQMLNSCIENINNFVKRGTRCPFLNCQP